MEPAALAQPNEGQGASGSAANPSSSQQASPASQSSAPPRVRFEPGGPAATNGDARALYEWLLQGQDKPWIGAQDPAQQRE